MTQEEANAIEAYANAKVGLALANQKLQQLFGVIEPPKPVETQTEPPTEPESTS